jgi:hypothetical protein
MTAWLLVGVFLAGRTLSVWQNHNFDCTTCPRELINHTLSHRSCIVISCHSQCTLNMQAAYACTSNNVRGSGMTNPPYLAWCIPRRPMWKNTEHIRCGGWQAACGRGGCVRPRGMEESYSAASHTLLVPQPQSWSGYGTVLGTGLQKPLSRVRAPLTAAH